jgi:hypothetical protein
MKKRIYNGADFCEHCDACPVVDHDPKTHTVVLHDPKKPERGSFTMTVKEYNDLLRHGKPLR